TYTDGTVGSVNGLNQGVWFAGQQNNFSVNLADYSDMFAHDSGYFLLGWDPMRHVDNLIPTYTAEQTVGVDTKTDAENALYAVWEPQIYVEFVNDTGAELRDVTLYIPSWIDGEVFRANTAKGKYAREPFSAFANGSATFDLAAGETLRLVLPDGAEKDFAVMGACSYAEGNKLVVTRIQPQIQGQEAIPDDVHSVYPGENYMVLGTMNVNPTPVQVRFTTTTYPAETDVPVRYFLHHPDGSVEEITADSGKWASFNNVKKTLTGIGGSTNDIAKLLQKSATESVHEYLTSSIKEQYGYTTIGIGAATGDFDEWRSITKGEPSGGSYIRFYREKLEWSRYSLFWNDYEDAAVYVVFFKRIPVHVTIGKTVEGSEEDKSPDKKFNFSVTYTEHSVKVSYTKTITKTMQRALTSNRNSRPDLPNNNTYVGDSTDYNPDDSTSLVDWSRWETGAWSDVVESPEAPTNIKYASDQTSDLFPARAVTNENFTLPDGGRRPLEIYYSSNGEGESTGNQVRSTRYTHTFTSATQSGSRYHTTQTVTWQETVPMEVTYQYETAVVTETDLDAKYTLTRIGDNPANDSDHCSGVVDLASRTYTISSINSNSINPVPGADATLYDFTPLDTAIFTNTRKTGSLTVSKTVVDGEAGDTFPFIVTLGETVVNKDSYTPPAGAHIGPYGKVFTFSLADGGSMTLPGLPAGASYTVEEVAHDKYVATMPANATGAIAADTTISVDVTNTHKTDLAIAMKDRTVIFTGEDQHGHTISEVTGTGGEIDPEAYKVTGLKDGHVLTVQHYVLPHGTAVGSYTGHVENVRFTVNDANDEDRDVTGEYIISMTPGALTIKPTPIIVTITGNTTNVVYNGKEQSVQGYTYVITHAETKEVLTSDSVYVSIPADYQMAWGKDVGTYYMHITPERVNHIVPEGMSVSEIVVAANGWLEISHAPVTVKAVDKFKILNRPDPPLTATVTGPAEGGLLFGDDSVAYTLSRAAGEAPGTYAITVSGEEIQGNYRVAYEPGTFTIEELELIQRATGSGVSVSVPVTDEMIDALGFDSKAELSASTVAAKMNAYDPNGLRHWENLVTGTETNQLLLGGAAATGDSLVTIGLGFDLTDPKPLGYTVLRELYKSARGTGAWTRVAGPLVGTNSPNFEIALVDVGGRSIGATGYYRVLTKLVPESVPSVTNTIPSTNVIGVLEIESVAAHTMAAVPFLELPTDPALNEPVKVASYVSSGFVADGDFIRLREDDTFKVWEKADGAFQPYTAVNTRGVATEVAGGEDSSLALGKSVWVSRATHSKPFFVVGQYCGDPVEVTIAGGTKKTPGSTMVTNPNLTELALNDIDWGENPNPGVAGDEIEIPLEADGTTSYRLFWNATKKQWGRNVPKRVGSRYVQTFETGFTVKPGMGFWYYRVSEEPFTVTVKEQQRLD
ncbi:MAG: hypothetical protein J6T01_01905, partial [Kiritimatiellae bacterium]|nr:hypothetical protein [Kiritimatiellia bacterium]